MKFVMFKKVWKRAFRPFIFSTEKKNILKSGAKICSKSAI